MNAVNINIINSSFPVLFLNTFLLITDYSSMSVHNMFSGLLEGDYIPLLFCFHSWTAPLILKMYCLTQFEVVGRELSSARNRC